MNIYRMVFRWRWFYNNVLTVRQRGWIFFRAFKANSNHVEKITIRN